MEHQPERTQGEVKQDVQVQTRGLKFELQANWEKEAE